MKISSWVERAICNISDQYISHIPHPVPSGEKLKQARLIAHRGTCSRQAPLENTLPAFSQAKTFGAWGIEFDLRWTKDFQPVISHDPDCRRLFGKEALISRLTLSELKRRCPAIPSLAEVIEAFGGDLHFMVEIKENFTAEERQNRVLGELFSGLNPVEDFHLISTYPHYFDSVRALPPEAFIPIAELNVRAISDLAVQKGYGGVSGHYMLLTDSVIKHLTLRRLRVGTGFINSPNCLFREINRGVTWLFSDRIKDLLQVQKELSEKDK